MDIPRNDKRTDKETEDPILLTDEELDALRIRLKEDVTMDPDERERIREIITLNEEYRLGI